MGVFNAYMALSGAYDATVMQGERMAHRTTHRIGGPTALLIEPHTYIALCRALDVLEREHVPWVAVGRGSNVLVSDSGYPGCVIKLGREFSRVSVSDEEPSLTVGGGAPLTKLVSAAQSHGLAGLECCAGVPGTVGGAIRLNAGLGHERIGRTVSSMVILSEGQGLHRLMGSEIVWSHRSCYLPDDALILEATFSATHGDGPVIASKMERCLVRRREGQPVGWPSCGLVFKDPPGHVARELIAASGLGGYAVGGVALSEVHANFMVNRGGATATDAMAVIRHAHEVVLERYGVDLQLGLRCLGFD